MAKRKARWTDKNASRVIRFAKEKNARGCLWAVQCATRKRAGIDLQQDSEGRLYLTRTSSDGFVQGWRLNSHDGKQLRVSPAHRPPR